MQTSHLPDRLAYLEPLRKQLRSLPVDIRAEGMDVELLIGLLRERTKGLSLEQARELLTEDQSELENWLSDPKRETHPLQVLLVFGLPALTEELFEPVEEEPETPPVIMDFPPASKPKKLYGGWRIKLEGGTLFVLPDNKKGYDLQIKLFNEPPAQHAYLIVQTVEAVIFGPVTGHKRVIRIDDLGSKQVDYVFQIPGGYALASILKKGASWDEACFEKAFHTIRVRTQENESPNPGS